MAADISTIEISCEGGLDLVSNAIQLFQAPGAATVLNNYESSIYGGYRRINGHEKFGAASATQPTGSADTILGVFRYADGVIACASTAVYFSTDGITWLQVNKDGASGGLDSTALAAAAALPRTSQGRCVFARYDGSEEYGIVSITDGVNKVAQFKITDTGGRKYYYEELGTATAAHQAPQWCVDYKERLVTAGDVTNPSEVRWSTRFDVNDFTGASAGAVDVGDVITGVKSFRENLYVFCKNSIHVISGIDGKPVREPVTRNIGCLSGFSIQEIGGDIVFLAPDGIRTLAATTRIDDVELSTISRKITPVITALTSQINSYDISSAVIRSRNQYRLFYTKSATARDKQQGIIGTFKYSSAGQPVWEWSETKGLEVTAISSEVDVNTIEQLYHGDYDGYIHKHDYGHSFDGTAIKATFRTPDINFGDSGLRKTLYEMRMSVRPENTSNLTLTLKYDFEDSDIHHPDPYSVEELYPSAVYGTGTYGSSHYGATALPLTKLWLEGSGTSASFKFETNDTTSTHTISGFYIDLIPASRVR